MGVLWYYLWCAGMYGSWFEGLWCEAGMYDSNWYNKYGRHQSLYILRNSIWTHRHTQRQTDGWMDGRMDGHHCNPLYI
jgi:hypothetical protein